jgi:hypothetical protein
MGLCDPQWLKVDLGKQKLAWDSVFILLNHEIIFPRLRFPCDNVVNDLIPPRTHTD